jgi:hypothetical protein
VGCQLLLLGPQRLAAGEWCHLTYILVSAQPVVVCQWCGGCVVRGRRLSGARPCRCKSSGGTSSSCSMVHSGWRLVRCHRDVSRHSQSQQQYIIAALALPGCSYQLLA